MLNAGPVNPVWGPMCPWGPRYGRFGRVGGHFVGWGLGLTVRDTTNKQNLDLKKVGENEEIFLFRCGPNEPAFVKNGAVWPLVPPLGAVHTEKTQRFSGHRRGNTKSLPSLPRFLIRVRFRVTELGSVRVPNSNQEQR